MDEPNVTRHFVVWDYVIFSIMLALSAAIGIYSALSGGRQRTAEEFFLGDRSMNIFPVAMSIVVSFVSAVSVIGTPGEIYMYNIVFAWGTVTYMFANLIICRLFLPVFFRLRITSIYEYLEMRFNRPLRLCGTLIFSINMIFYMGIVMYTPALAINAVTGMNLWLSVLSTGFVCIFYTTVGGLKAVLWTDTLQAFILIIGVIAVIIKGSMDIGGIGEVIRIASEGERLKFFEMNPDPRIRYTFWSIIIGMGTLNVGSGLNQTIMQRLLSCGTRRRATQSLIVATFFKMFTVGLCIFSGVVMYAYYAECDPYTQGVVRSKDQLMPLLVMEIFENIPGLPGLFLSSVVAASLSTLSSGINSLAAITGEDVIKAIWPNMKQSTYAVIMKFIAVLYGFISIGFAFLTSILDRGVLSLCLSLAGITSGGLMGVFMLGIFFHRCSSKGAMCGLVSSILFTGWMQIGTMVYPNSRDTSPLSVDGCPAYNTTETVIEYVTDVLPGATAWSASSDSSSLTSTMAITSSMEPVSESQPGIANLYHVSYIYYTPIGMFICIVVSMVVTALTGFADPDAVDPRLKYNLTDAIFCCFPESWKIRMRCGAERIDKDYNEVDDDDVKDIKFVKVSSGEPTFATPDEKELMLEHVYNGTNDVRSISTTV